DFLPGGQESRRSQEEVSVRAERTGVRACKAGPRFRLRDSSLRPCHGRPDLSNSSAAGPRDSAPKTQRGGGMRRLIGFPCVAAAALALAGCGVQLQDETPGKFPVNADIGMYPITVKVTSGAMVSQPVYLWLVS